jgi:CheY-like chemotaxis protein
LTWTFSQTKRRSRGKPDQKPKPKVKTDINFKSVEHECPTHIRNRGFAVLFCGRKCGVLVVERYAVPTRILIADDDATIRLLLRRLLEQQPDWQVCGDASTGAEAIAKVEQLNPDVVVMDLSMPVMTGLQAAPAIARAHPRLPMLLISVQEVSRQLAWEARNAGYRGAVTKNSGNEVLRGVEALLRKETFFWVDDGSSISAELDQ